MIHPTATGVEIDVRVIPRAGRSTVAGERDGRVLVRLSAPPVDGAANDALIEFLASQLDCAKRQVRIVSGEKSRSKRVSVTGVSAATVKLRLSG